MTSNFQAINDFTDNKKKKKIMRSFVVILKFSINKTDYIDRQIMSGKQ